MNNKRICIFIIVLCLSISGCTSNTPTDSTDSNSDNSNYRKAKGINLLYEYDMLSKTWTGSYYQLRLWDDKCTLTYFNKDNSKTLYCDFSLDVYNEVIELICSHSLEKYEYPTDSNGKIIYETIPYILELFFGGYERPVLLKDPANMNEIIAKFESLKAAATQ